MAPHSSVLARRIPGTGSLVGCRLWGLEESDTTEVIQQQEQRQQCVLLGFLGGAVVKNHLPMQET